MNQVILTKLFKCNSISSIIFLIKEYNCSFLHFFKIDIDECNVTEPCQNNGNCSNTFGSYICDCQSGWQGKNCQTGRRAFRVIILLASNLASYSTINNVYLAIADIDECTIEPCENNGTCHNSNGSYQCECMSGFQGHHCGDGK